MPVLRAQIYCPCGGGRASLRCTVGTDCPYGIAATGDGVLWGVLARTNKYSVYGSPTDPRRFIRWAFPCLGLVGGRVCRAFLPAMLRPCNKVMQALGLSRLPETEKLDRPLRWRMEACLSPSSCGPHVS